MYQKTITIDVDRASPEKLVEMVQRKGMVYYSGYKEMRRDQT